MAEYPTLNRGRWRFAADEVKIYGRPLPSGLMVDAREIGGASCGDTVEFLADLYEPSGLTAPGGLDWGAFLARRGIAAEARAREVEVLRAAGPLLRLARAFRQRAVASFSAALPPGAAAVMAGVVIGEKRAVPPDIKAAFQDSGAMHLLVASGSNVGFVALISYWLCSLLRLNRRRAGAAALLAAGFYVLACGLEPPLVRAYLMFGAGLAAYTFRREAGAFHSLTVAALAILLTSPRALFDAGFQLSFLAAYGLTVGVGAWGALVSGGARAAGAVFAPAPAASAGALAALGGTLLVSFFAQLFLLPALLHYFHRVSAVSMLSNIFLVPASGIAMAAGFVLAALGPDGPLSGLAGAAGSAWMGVFIGAVKFFAALPGASFSVPPPPPAWTAGFFLLAFAIAHAPLFGARSRSLYALAAAGLLLMAAAGRRHAPPAGGGRAQLFGDSNTFSALITLPSGELCLVNPGLNGQRLAAAALASGGTEIDLVLLTSAEEKNFSGLEELARRLPVRRVLLPYGPAHKNLGRLLERLAKNGAAAERRWPLRAGEAAGPGPEALWPGEPGYTGRGDFADWKIGPLLVSSEGAAVSAGPLSAAAVKGEVVTLNFSDRILNSSGRDEER